MKLVALHTIHGRKVMRKRDPRNPKDRGESTEMLAKPGQEFDTDEFGIDDKEAANLVAAKAARRRMREVADHEDTGAAGGGQGAPTA